MNAPGAHGHARPRRWLHDPSGILARLLEPLDGLEDATALLGHARATGTVLVGGAHRLLIGDNEYALLLALELEERSGEDLFERYRDHGEGCDQARYDAIFAAPPAHSSRWASELARAQLGLERHTRDDLERAVRPTWWIDLGQDFS